MRRRQSSRFINVNSSTKLNRKPIGESRGEKLLYGTRGGNNRTARSRILYIDFIYTSKQQKQVAVAGSPHSVEYNRDGRKMRAFPTLASASRLCLETLSSYIRIISILSKKEQKKLPLPFF